MYETKAQKDALNKFYMRLMQTEEVPAHTIRPTEIWYLEKLLEKVLALEELITVTRHFGIGISICRVYELEMAYGISAAEQSKILSNAFAKLEAIKDEIGLLYVNPIALAEFILKKIEEINILKDENARLKQALSGLANRATVMG